MIRYSSETRIDSIGSSDDNRRFTTLAKKPRVPRSSHTQDTLPSTSSPCSVGTLRLYSQSGDQSRQVTVSMETAVQELCTQLGSDSIFLQIGNDHCKALPPTVCPLRVMVDILETIGYSSISECIALSPQPFLKHIFAFFLGQPQKRDDDEEFLRAKAWIRKGKMMKRWTRADCLLYNHTVRISKIGEEDDIILLGGARVDRHITKRGESLRIDTPTTQFCLLFDDSSSLHSWIGACRKSEVTSRCDFSSRGLLHVPSHVFSSRGGSILTHLNLRRNSLLIRANSITSSPAPLLGWVEDIGRLTLLEHLDLSSNRLGSFPPPLSQLSHLTRLSLAGNQLDTLSIHIRLLVNLNSLDLSNNWLSDLPFQLTECTYLTHLNLSFNRFKKIPNTLFHLKGVTTWKLAGNEISSFDVPSEIIQKIDKLDLRRNCITRNFRLSSPPGDRLSDIDLRDNPDLSAVQLMNLPSIRVLRVDRLQLTHLQVNGNSLTHLHASHNLLDTLIVMPIPQSLHTLDISHNRLLSLPDWLSDITSLEHIDASHNLIRTLPVRLLAAPSLRSLLLHRNRLIALPDTVDSPVESIDIHSNRLQYLPTNFFVGAKRLRDLNISSNLLESLPSPPPSHRLRSLKAAFNHLNESIIPLICSFRSLVILHLAHNKIHFFDDSSLRELRLLEEVNLSSNSLSSLSLTIPSLPALRVLRAHSNLLETLPTLANSRSLTIIDVSNNRLSRVDTARCTGITLRQLDLTCNSHLTFNQSTINPALSDHRPLSFVRLNHLNNFSYGFSQSAGNKNKLCIQQLLPPVNSSSSLFGMIDGGSNSQIAAEIKKTLLGICDDEPPSNCESLSRALLQTHVSIGGIGEKLGANVLLCLLKDSSLHISSSGSIRVSLITSLSPSLSPSSSLVLSHLLPSLEIDDAEYARVRHACSILDENNRIDGVTLHPRQIGLTYLFPAVVPAPVTVSHQLSLSISDSQYLVIANDSIWRVVPDEIIVSILSETPNPHVAAKSIQDAAESFGCSGNASVIVIKLTPSSPSASVSARSDSKGALDSTISVDGEETKLRAIEERLEKISQVIASIDSPPTVSPSSLPVSPPPLPVSSPPLYSTLSSLHHIGPRGSLHLALKSMESSSPSITRLSLSSPSPSSLRWDDPLSHLPDPISYRTSSPSSSSHPPPDPSRARFHAARSALQDNLRLNPPGSY
ncbi:hypothetical protein PFISCL1PPCAC_10258 [Pristionchus fissidentatus]|uniref:PPM-type phosphatase domain-containing protein n=1 Tax=Pristionchus fissidentatus TaxID=1538716 RepID=A0AAV5VH39_9BILA|nr:hypothetical protein PFISCL1PPCAC_10258 [Pristionchus fissidentatus]